MGDLPRPMHRKAKGSARNGKTVLCGRRKGPESAAPCTCCPWRKSSEKLGWWDAQEEEMDALPRLHGPQASTEPTPGGCKPSRVISRNGSKVCGYRLSKLGRRDRRGKNAPRVQFSTRGGKKKGKKRIQMTQDDRTGTRTLTKRSMTVLVGPLVAGGAGGRGRRARGSQYLEA